MAPPRPSTRRRRRAPPPPQPPGDADTAAPEAEEAEGGDGGGGEGASRSSAPSSSSSSSRRTRAANRDRDRDRDGGGGGGGNDVVVDDVDVQVLPTLLRRLHDLIDDAGAEPRRKCAALLQGIVDDPASAVLPVPSGSSSSSVSTSASAAAEAAATTTTAGTSPSPPRKRSRRRGGAGAGATGGGGGGGATRENASSGVGDDVFGDKMGESTSPDLAAAPSDLLTTVLLINRLASTLASSSSSSASPSPSAAAAAAAAARDSSTMDDEGDDGGVGSPPSPSPSRRVRICCSIVLADLTHSVCRILELADDGCGGRGGGLLDRCAAGTTAGSSTSTMQLGSDVSPGRGGAAVSSSPRHLRGGRRGVASTLASLGRGGSTEDDDPLSSSSAVASPSLGVSGEGGDGRPSVNSKTLLMHVIVSVTLGSTVALRELVRDVGGDPCDGNDDSFEEEALGVTEGDVNRALWRCLRSLEYTVGMAGGSTSVRGGGGAGGGPHHPAPAPAAQQHPFPPSSSPWGAGAAASSNAAPTGAGGSAAGWWFQPPPTTSSSTSPAGGGGVGVAAASSAGGGAKGGRGRSSSDDVFFASSLGDVGIGGKEEEGGGRRWRNVSLADFSSAAYLGHVGAPASTMDPEPRAPLDRVVEEFLRASHPADHGLYLRRMGLLPDASASSMGDGVVDVDEEEEEDEDEEPKQRKRGKRRRVVASGGVGDKRKKNKKKKLSSAPDPHAAPDGRQLYPHLSIGMEANARISYRRWGSVTLIHIARNLSSVDDTHHSTMMGVDGLLEASAQILGRDVWKTVMDDGGIPRATMMAQPPPARTADDDSSATKKKTGRTRTSKRQRLSRAAASASSSDPHPHPSRKKKRHHQEASATPTPPGNTAASFSSPHIPGRVMRVVYVSKLLSVISDALSNCGGGYVGAATVGTTVTRGGGGTSSSTAGIGMGVGTTTGGGGGSGPDSSSRRRPPLLVRPLSRAGHGRGGMDVYASAIFSSSSSPSIPAPAPAPGSSGVDGEHADAPSSSRTGRRPATARRGRGTRRSPSSPQKTTRRRRGGAAPAGAGGDGDGGVLPGTSEATSAPKVASMTGGGVDVGTLGLRVMHNLILAHIECCRRCDAVEDKKDDDDEEGHLLPRVSVSFGELIPLLPPSSAAAIGDGDGGIVVAQSTVHALLGRYYPWICQTMDTLACVIGGLAPSSTTTTTPPSSSLGGTAGGPTRDDDGGWCDRLEYSLPRGGRGALVLDAVLPFRDYGVAGGGSGSAFPPSPTTRGGGGGPPSSSATNTIAASTSASASVSVHSSRTDVSDFHDFCRRVTGVPHLPLPPPLAAGGGATTTSPANSPSSSSTSPVATASAAATEWYRRVMVYGCSLAMRSTYESFLLVAGGGGGGGGGPGDEESSPSGGVDDPRIGSGGGGGGGGRFVIDGKLMLLCASTLLDATEVVVAAGVGVPNKSTTSGSASSFVGGTVATAVDGGRRRSSPRPARIVEEGACDSLLGFVRAVNGASLGGRRSTTANVVVPPSSKDTILLLLSILRSCYDVHDGGWSMTVGGGGSSAPLLHRDASSSRRLFLRHHRTCRVQLSVHVLAIVRHLLRLSSSSTTSIADDDDDDKRRASPRGAAARSGDAGGGAPLVGLDVREKMHVVKSVVASCRSLYRGFLFFPPPPSSATTMADRPTTSTSSAAGGWHVAGDVDREVENEDRIGGDETEMENNKAGRSTFGPSSRGVEYTLEDRKLWSAHIKVCLTLARDTASFRPPSFRRRPAASGGSPSSPPTRTTTTGTATAKTASRSSPFLLGDAKFRLEVYRAVADAAAIGSSSSSDSSSPTPRGGGPPTGRRRVIERSKNEEVAGGIVADTAFPFASWGDAEAGNRGCRWPLDLPAAYHALVTSNLCSEPLPSDDDDSAAPEIFLCESILAGIDRTFEVYRDFFSSRRSSSSFHTSPDAAAVGGRILLRLWDSRLLALALCRLPTKRRVEMLSKIVSHVYDGLMSCFTPPLRRDDETEMMESLTHLPTHVLELLRDHRRSTEEIGGGVILGLSGFLARLITVLVTVIDLATVHPDTRVALLEALAHQAGSMHYHLPHLPPPRPNETTGGGGGVRCGDDEGDEDDAVDGRQQDEEWYKRDTCFMGIFADWESPSIPLNASSTPVRMSPLADDEDFDLDGPVKDSVTKFSSIVEVALGLGVETARVDRCHLLFASWNASAKMYGWAAHEESYPRLSLAASSSAGGGGARLISIRSDVYTIHRALHPAAKRPDSLLSRRLQRAFMRPATVDEVRELLERGMAHATNVLDTLLDKVCGAPSSQSGFGRKIPPIVYVNMEALAVYLAFLVAQHTKPEEDCISAFSKAHGHRRSHKKHRGKRSRKDSGASNDGEDAEMDDAEEGNMLSDEDEESDGEGGGYSHKFDDDDDDEGNDDGGDGDGDDDDDDDDDARIDALARLHDACYALGAAPTHPDWLDKFCHFRSGVTWNMAVTSAESALRALTRLGNVAYGHFMMSARRYLARHTCASESIGDDGVPSSPACRADLALMLLSSIDATSMTKEGEDDKRPNSTSLMEAISRISSIKEVALHRIWARDFCDKSVSDSRDVWCPNSAHCMGLLQELSPAIEGWETTSFEQRAAGEWELLLSDALLNSVRERAIVDSNDEDATDIDRNDGDGDSVTRDKSEEEKSDLFEACEELVRMEQWHDLLSSAVDALLPASALFRFGVMRGKGRKPLSRRQGCGDSTAPDPDDISAMIPPSPLRSSDEKNGDRLSSASSPERRQAVFGTLELLSLLSSNAMISGAFRKTCRVAASHLVADTSSDMVHLERIQALRSAFGALIGVDSTIKNLCSGGDEVKSDLQDSKKAFHDISHWLLSSVENRAASVVKNVEDDSNSLQFASKGCLPDKFLVLYCSLGVSDVLSVDTIADSVADATEVLATVEPGASDLRAMKPLAMERQAALSLLVSMLVRPEWSLDITMQLRITDVLCGLLNAELTFITKPTTREVDEASGVRFAVLKALDTLETDIIEKLVKERIIMFPSSEKSPKSLLLSRGLSSMFGSLLPATASPSYQINGSRACRVVLRALLSTFGHWSCDDLSTSRKHVMVLLCLFATRFDALCETGEHILAVLQSAFEEVEDAGGAQMVTSLGHLELFLRFVRRVVEFLSKYPSDGNVPDSDVSRAALPSAQSSVREGSEKGFFFRTTDSSHPPGKKSADFPMNSDSKTYVTSSGAKVLRTCSYCETGGDFTEQHWYNCYTCGLLWDKGCCSLCALVCHQGHDVGYSRRSSFFCDCGADAAGGRGTSCQCLAPLSPKKLASVYNDDVTKNAVVLTGSAKDMELLPDSFSVDSDVNLRALLGSSARQAQHAVESFTASDMKWTTTIFDYFNRSFQVWASKRSSPLNLESFQAHGAFSSEVMGKRSNQGAGSSSLLRNGKPLKLQALRDKSMIPIRSAKSNAVNAKLSCDATTDRLKKNLLTKNDIRRRIIVADDRGRLIIAEPCSLLFCCAPPIVNTRHVRGSLETPLERSQLFILGTASIKFNIVGMQICPVNNRHLVIWGTSEACVAVLSKACDAIEKRVDLVIELEPHECDSEYLLKCEWMPSSEKMVVVVCGTFLKVFDLKRASSDGVLEKESSVRSTTCYTLAYEDVLLRAAILMEGSVEKVNPQTKDATDDETSVKLVLLLDTGRLHTTELRMDANGDLEDQGESYIECGEGLRFPVEGIRRYVGSNPGMGGTSTSFGDGSSLDFLKQSGLILYKCLSAPLVAMKMDESGSIVSSFELLPHVLTTDVLSNGVDGYSISAPYTHFTELGCYKKEGVLTYRIACVGKSTRTNQPKLLCVEFSEEFVRAKELSWPSGGGMDLGINLSTSIEGLAVFSAPFLVGQGTKSGFVGNSGTFYERATLVAVHSNGSLLFFSEELDGEAGDSILEDEHSEVSNKVCGRNAGHLCHGDDGVGVSKISQITGGSKNVDAHCLQPKFPLQIFEHLINISEQDRLVYGGDGIGNEASASSTKKKLSITNGEFIISPTREGCTLTVSVRSVGARNGPDKSEPSKRKPKHKHGGTSDKKSTSIEGSLAASSDISSVAIVAVRLLLGSTTTEYLPKVVTIMGRKVKLLQGVKRWYDIPLTDEEICLGVRCGCVCIGVGSSFDISNCPLIDALEVYAKERRDFPFLCSRLDDFSPIRTSRILGTVHDAVSLGQSEYSGSEEGEISIDDALNSSIMCVTHIRHIFKDDVDVSEMPKKTVHRLAQMTALDTAKSGGVREHIVEVLKEVEADAEKRTYLMDEGTLLGVSGMLKSLLAGFQERTEKSCWERGSSKSEVAGQNQLISGRQIADEHLMNMLATVSKCLTAALKVAKERPLNYRALSIKMATSSLASDVKVLLDVMVESQHKVEVTSRSYWILPFSKDVRPKTLWDTVDYSEVVSRLVELSIIEMSIARGIENVSEHAVNNFPFADFRLISEVVRSHNAEVVKQCCLTIAKILGELNSSRDDEEQLREGDNVQNRRSQVESQHPIAYQCDGCELFPITSLRFTLDGEDIDLCKKCFDRSCSDAELPNRPSVKIGKNRELTWEQIGQMRPVPVESAIVEQAERAKRARLVTGVSSTECEQAGDMNESFASGDIDDDDAALKLALEMSLQDPSPDTMSPCTDEQNTPPNQLKGFIFESLLEETTKMAFFELNSPTIAGMPPRCGSFGVNNLFHLILHLVVTSETGELRAERGRKVAESVVTMLSRLVGSCLNDEMTMEETRVAHVSLVIAMNTLENLLLGKDPLVEGSEPSEVARQCEGDSSSFGTKNKVKTDPRFVCDEHKVPAVRRRCSHGVHKERRFYVCGMEPRKARCKYFKWADEDVGGKCNDASTATRQGDDSNTAKASSLGTTDDVDGFLRKNIWQMFSVQGESGAPSLQSQLCELLMNTRGESEKLSVAQLTSATSARKPSNEEEQASQCRMSSTNGLDSARTEESIREDWQDGVFRNREKFGPMGPDILPCSEQKREENNPKNVDQAAEMADSESAVVQASLNLLSHLAMNSLRSNQGKEQPRNESWSNLWFSLLCEIISTTTSAFSHQRSQAKRMLKRLCGGRRTTYHRVRDHYVFAFQFKNLLYYCGGPLQAAIDVKQRAKLCGINWKGSAVTWSNLKPGDLLGVDGLVTEDSLTVSGNDMLTQVLGELTDTTKSRGRNWRKFCALKELPHHQRGKRANLVGEGNDDGDEHSRPPMFSLFWMACSLSGSCQVSLFHLIDVALTSEDSSASIEAKSSEDRSSLTHEESGGVLSTDGGCTDVEPSGERNLSTAHSPPPVDARGEAVTPESVLLSRHDGLTVDNIVTFILQFVMRGRSQALRAVAAKVAGKMLCHLSNQDLNKIFLRLVDAPLTEIGPLGCTASEFLDLLQAVVRDYGPKGSIDLSKAGNSVVSCFVQQFITMSMDFCEGVGEEAGVVEVESESGKVAKRYDLSSCVHCHRSCVGLSEKERRKIQEKESFSSNARPSERTISDSASAQPSAGSGQSTLAASFSKSKDSGKDTSKVPWLPEQVRKYTRSRVESSTERLVSTEFSTFVQLKSRLAVSEVHLSVTDPRGRLVKTIGISFSPRQVGNVNDLKSEDYADIWQQCGTLNLARGSVRASCTLKTPVIAANLKFEYLEFYEKAGGSRSADGGLLLTCPRCTRVVNNAHGVCGHCGEVAFQCRKCRHINYDRLDAFLCVECGHCASGGFGYEITAGIASNAVAILDEDGLDRAFKLYRVAMKRHGETRNALRKKLLAAASLKRKRCGRDVERLGDMDKYPSALKRALLGDLPKGGSKFAGDSGGDAVGRRSSGVSASRRDQNRMSAASKARSLLNLARQLRSESGLDAGDRSSRGDILVRQALLNAGGSGGSIEIFDDGGALCESDGEVFGIINSGSNVLQGGDMSDPLSRLVANIQARVRNSSAGTGSGSSNDGVADSGKKSGSSGKGSGGGSGGSGGGGGSNGGTAPASPTSQIDECDKLHQQMRESERECFELQRTINGWDRLNSDSLACYETSRPMSSFVPTSCSVCACPVALHLLFLAMAVLGAGWADVEFSITADFIRTLFDEPQGMSNELSDLKRVAIITLASQSENGARLVLEELRMRLRATRDVASAEILGALLEREFSLAGEYAQLALEVMSGEK